MTEDDVAAVTAIVRASGSSFYRGMRILPPERRGAMYGVYAFCRLVDDIADEPAPIEEKTARLAAWHERIGALAAGAAGADAVERVLAMAIERYGLDVEDFRAVIEGMAMDAGSPLVAPDLSTLDLYCDRVASAVGRLAVRVFGEASPRGREVAHHLGRALQLTNILRDLAEDAERGRLYLPREYLTSAGVPREPAGALASARLGEVLERVADLAAGHFATAEAAMGLCDRQAMRPARLMAASYAAILAALRQRGWDRPTEQVRLSPLVKLRLAAGALWS